MKYTVDIDKGDRFSNYIKNKTGLHQNPNVITSDFCSVLKIPSNMDDGVLVLSTDGIGTKISLAQSINDYNSLGIDLVAMVVNDIITSGATPYYFLDYLANDILDLERSKSILKSIIIGCDIAGVSLVGGETAELRGIFRSNQGFDVAGFGVGFVESDNIIDASNIHEGDELFAIPSSGVHSNGFTLVNEIVNKVKPNANLIKSLLTPTRIYVDEIHKLNEQVPIVGIANITGGGLYNIERIVPSGLVANIDYFKNSNGIFLHDIFTWLQKHGELSQEEMYRVFNCGFGMVVCVAKDYKTQVLQILPDMIKIGEITKNESADQRGLINIL